MKQPTIEEVKQRIEQERTRMQRAALSTMFNLGYGPLLEEACDHYYHAGMGSRPKADVSLILAMTGEALTAEEILEAYQDYLDGELTLLKESQCSPQKR